MKYAEELCYKGLGNPQFASRDSRFLQKLDLFNQHLAISFINHQILTNSDLQIIELRETKHAQSQLFYYIFYQTFLKTDSPAQLVQHAKFIAQNQHILLPPHSRHRTFRCSPTGLLLNCRHIIQTEYHAPPSRVKGQPTLHRKPSLHSGSPRLRWRRVRS